MRKILESMQDIVFDKYFNEDGTKDWGDQIDVFVSAAKQEDLEGNVSYDVTFIRCPKSEFTNKHDILEKANLLDFSDMEFLRKENENLKSGLNDAMDMIIEMVGG